MEQIGKTLRKNNSKEYESLVTLRLDNSFKEKFPIAYQNKVDELVEEGAACDEQAAAAMMENMEVELELYYEQGRGFFAVETEAVECSPVYSPYTKAELEDCCV